VNATLKYRAGSREGEIDGRRKIYDEVNEYPFSSGDRSEAGIWNRGKRGKVGSLSVFSRFPIDSSKCSSISFTPYPVCVPVSSSYGDHYLS
jgi:hypothetical protein